MPQPRRRRSAAAAAAAATPRTPSRPKRVPPPANRAPPTTAGDAAVAGRASKRRRRRLVGAPSAVTPIKEAAAAAAPACKPPAPPSRSTAASPPPGPKTVGAGDAASASSTTHVLGSIDFRTDFSLSQAICSYGYVGLAPNQWVPAAADNPNDDDGVYIRPLVYGTPHREEHHVVVKVLQVAPRAVEVVAIGGDMAVPRKHVEQVLAQVRRILRQGWSPEAFWALHTEAHDRGFGRTFRSPTLWEDMVKTLTNCNMNWKGTCQMNAQLCKELGHGGAAFPTPAQVLTAADSLQGRCRLGYRTRWVVDLAARFVKGRVDTAWFEDPTVPTADLQKAVLAFKGFGRFASFNVLQLLGHHAAFPFDTETVRLFREEKGVAKSVPSPKVHKQAEDYYAAFEPYQFLAYWFDLWKNYERRAGLPSPRWVRDTCELIG